MKRLLFLIILIAGFETISPHTKYISGDKDSISSVSVPKAGFKAVNSGYRNSEISLPENPTGQNSNPDAGLTFNNKLTFSTAKIDECRHTGSVYSALYGKVPGLTIITPSGEPGIPSIVSIRGSFQLTGLQSPLLMLDGAILEDTFVDINVDDIESVEILRGPAASALYGSRGGKGVIAINTRRGDLFQEGKTEIVFRNEYGINRLTRKYDLATHHAYMLADDQNQFKFTKYYGVTYPDGYSVTMPGITGARITEDDQYMDNPYAAIFDHQDAIFPGNDFITNYISAGANLGKFNYLASFENYMQSGLLAEVKGYRRNSFRVNFDYRIIPDLTVSASNLYVRSRTSAPGGDDKTSAEIFADALISSPDADFNIPNPDGQPFIFIPDIWNPEIENPVYNLSKFENETGRSRFTGTYRAKFTLMDILDLEACYSFQYKTTQKSIYIPYDTYSLSGGIPVYSKGSLSETNSSLLSGNAMVTAGFKREFGDFNTVAKLSYLFEKTSFNSESQYGEDFSRPGIRSFDAITGSRSISSYKEKTISKYITGNLFASYQEKYLVDALFCYNGTSLSGSEARWHPYFRLSSAYRLTEDFEIPGVSELRLRMGFGIAGSRSRFTDRFEILSVSAGNLFQYQLGNEMLKPSVSQEFETGLNLDFLERFSFEIVYSISNVRDLILSVPLPAQSGGWVWQVRNAGRMNIKALEASLKANMIKTRDFNYDVTLLFDRVRQKITRLDAPPFLPTLQGEEAITGFYAREGEVPGTMFGYSWIRSLEEMKNQLAESDLPSTWWDDSRLDSYVVNSDGFVIIKGTEGTTSEIPIKKTDRNGEPLFSKIGDTNPDFRLSLSNSMFYKGFGLYALLEWKNGGNIYNRTAQWLAGNNRHRMMDQSGNPDYLKKAMPYYKGFYDSNSINDFWVEDGSYLKLRELSLSYNIPSSTVKDFFKGYIKDIKLSLTGRNIYTLTNYTGYDPEVLITDGIQYYAYDFAGYPHYSSYSLSIEFKF